MKNLIHHYNVGALLYCPANLENIVTSIVEDKIPSPFSLAMCLEDTIADEQVDKAVKTLVTSLNSLHKTEKKFYMPNIFIRVRNAEQMLSLWAELGEAKAIVHGFISPKFTPENAKGYINNIKELNLISDKPVYFMPILESDTMINLVKRPEYLNNLKNQLDEISQYVANIRVGGNDLCHAFGIRRRNNESIHDIPVISSIFSDIMAVFGIDYVISGAVWEYYAGEGWDTGLKAELKADRRNGFVGKTVIHPNQIPIVNAIYKVAKTDYDDACAILNWSTVGDRMVAGSSTHERMNEYKTHSNWAEKILLLAEAYGVRE